MTDTHVSMVDEKAMLGTKTHVPCCQIHDGIMALCGARPPKDRKVSLLSPGTPVSCAPCVEADHRNGCPRHGTCPVRESP